MYKASAYIKIPQRCGGSKSAQLKQNSINRKQRNEEKRRRRKNRRRTDNNRLVLNGGAACRSRARRQRRRRGGEKKRMRCANSRQMRPQKMAAEEKAAWRLQLKI